MTDLPALHSQFLELPNSAPLEPAARMTHVAKVYEEFEDNGRMKPSAYYDRVVDVMEELMKFTLLARDRAGHLVDRYSELKAEGRATVGDEPCADAMRHERKAG